MSVEGRALRVVVADDQTVVRDGLATLLDLLPDITVVGRAADGAQALALVAEESPDVVLMDLRMPVLDGVEATRRIRADHPDTQVVVLTTYVDETEIVGALQAGALGYLTKDATRTEIHQALVAAASGQAILDAKVQQRLVKAASSPRPTVSGDPPALPDGLTTREGDVLRLIAAGHSNREIAAALFVSEATVKTHINRLFAKTGVRDRAQAVQYAYRHGVNT